MQAAVSSVNCGLKPKPRTSKKVIEAFRSFTGMFTKSLRGFFTGMECRRHERRELIGPPDRVPAGRPGLRRQGERQPEAREEPLGVEEGVDAGHPATSNLQHHQPPGVEALPGPTVPELAERRRAIRRGGHT